MVLVAPHGSVRSWPHLAVVAGDNGGGNGALAGKLAEAQAAAAGLRKRLSDLEAALAVAVEAVDFTGAADLQRQLEPAREELALAEIEIRVIGEAQAGVEQARQAAQRAVQEAQQRAQAQGMLDAANEADRHARETTAAALDVMRSNLLAARAAFDEARRAEAGVGTAQRQAIEARRAMGEYGRNPGPVATGSNAVQALAGRDPLVRELARWHP
jgi:hypothetical protein